MSFAPVLPLSGYAGWRVFDPTITRQQAAFAENPQIARETAAFRDQIAEVETAADLVADRSLLKVALGAFGLDDDLPNRFFIQKVLEEGTLDPDALANKLTDTRYRDMAAAFGFDDFALRNTAQPGFADQITAAYETRAFEAAVGEQNEAFRLVLDARRSLPDLAAGGGSDDAKWFRVLGTAPLREVFETAFDLPDAFGSIDIDRQVDILRTRTESLFGSGEVSVFTDPKAQEGLMRRFLVQSELQGSAGSVASSPALALLSGSASSASAVLAALYS